MKRILLILSILVFSITLFAGQIDGTVTFNDTGEAAAGIAVTLLSNDPAGPETIVNTNEAGYYIFTELENGFHLVLVDIEGYLPFMEQVVLNGNNSEVTLDIELISFTPPDPIGSVAGTVRNDMEEPIEDAIVILMNGNGGPGSPFNLETVSGPDGTYLFADLPAGEFELMAFAEGYLPAEPIEIEITEENPDLTGIDFILEPFEEPDPIGSVAGIVQDEAEQPIEGAMVHLFTGQNFPFDPLFFETVTGPDGTFLFENLPAEEYNLMAMAEGYMQEEEIEVEISEEDPDITGIVIVLTEFQNPDPIGSVAGTVWNEAEEPVEGAMVMLMGGGGPGPGGPFNQETVTGPDGTYSFVELPAGEFELMAFAEGYLLAEPIEIEITEEEPDLIGIDFILEPFENPDPIGSVAGIVQDEDEVPMEGAIVHLFTGQNFPFDPLFFETVTGPDGTFLFENLPAEEYNLMAMAEGYMQEEEIEVEVTEETPDITGIVIVLTEFQTPDPIGSIGGTVIAEDSLAIPGAQVILMLDEDEYGMPFEFEQMTDESGAFLFTELPAGEYELFVFAEGYMPSEELELEITEENPDILDLIIVLEPWSGQEGEGIISGFVINHLGESVEAAVVMITNEQYPYNQEVVTGEDGAFNFEELPWGNYWLDVYAEGYLPGWFSNPGGQPVPIHVNEDNPIVEDIYITLLPENGGYEGNCELTIIIQNDENPSEVNHISLFNTDLNMMYEDIHTGNEFTIAGLPEGLYIVGIHTPGYMMYFYENATSPEEADLVELLEDDPVTIIVDLSGYEQTPYLLTGTITNNLGEPVEGALVSALPADVWGGGGMEQFITVTDESGYYELEVCEGEFIISAFAPEYTVTFWPGTLDFESAEPLEIESDLTGIDLTLYPVDFNGFSITGTVTIEGSPPETPVLVIAVSSDEDEEPYTESIMVGNDGSYEIPLDFADEYYVLAITSGAFPMFYSEVYDWEDALLVDVNGMVSDINFNLSYPVGQGLENISGVITNNEGDPLTGVTVLMFDINNMPVAFGTTNSLGQYSISFLGNTEYTFLATKVYYESFETLVNPADQDQVNAYLNPAQSTAAGDDLPTGTELLSNYPNPFNPETKIEFYISEAALTELSIYNVKGQKVITLIDEELSSGLHSVVWDGKDRTGRTLTSGIYFYKLSSGADNSTRKMILMK